VIIATSFNAGETGPYDLTTQFAVPEPSVVLLDFSALAALAALWVRRREHG